MDKETYHYEYLQSEHWQEIRLKRLEEDNYRCAICGSEENLCVHHLSYSNLGNEYLSDLITLCKNHHTRWHKQDDKKRHNNYRDIFQSLIKKCIFANKKTAMGLITEYIYNDALIVGKLMRDITGDSKMRINGMKFSTAIRIYFNMPKISSISSFPIREIGGIDAQVERILRGKKKAGGINTLEEIKVGIPKYFMEVELI